MVADRPRQRLHRLWRTSCFLLCFHVSPVNSSLPAVWQETLVSAAACHVCSPDERQPINMEDLLRLKKNKWSDQVFEHGAQDDWKSLNPWILSWHFWEEILTFCVMFLFVLKDISSIVYLPVFLNPKLSVHYESTFTNNSLLPSKIPYKDMIYWHIFRVIYARMQQKYLKYNHYAIPYMCISRSLYNLNASEHFCCVWKYICMCVYVTTHVFVRVWGIHGHIYSMSIYQISI